MTEVTDSYVYPDTLPVLCRPLKVPVRQYGPVTSRRVEQEPREPRFTTPTWFDQEPPEWAQTPPEPLVHLKAGWKKINDGINDGTDRTVVGAACGGTILALLWYPWLGPTLVTLLWVGSIVYGLSVVWLCRTGGRPWKWATRRASVATGAVAALGLLWTVNGRSLPVLVMALAAAQGFAYRPAVADGPPTWWSDKRLAFDWAAAGIFGQRVPEDLWFRRIVPMHLDENGIRSTTVVPMTGPRKDAHVVNVGADAVDKARPALERVMGLKVGQLHISHDDDHDAGAITLTVVPPPRKDIVKAVLPITWDYDKSLFVGKDLKGQPLERPTWGRHAMFVGATGSGKTWAGRYEIAHAVLDPTISFYLIDGKGDAIDWEPLHPLCKQVVLGASRAAALKAYAVLQEIEQVSDSRSTLLGEAPGIVVVVDEWYRLIGAAKRHDAAMAKEMAALFSELLATARSRRIRFLTFWQRGTDSYIDTDMRGNMVQRFVGITGDKADARYPLDAVPDMLPKAPGQFNYKDSGSRPVLVTMPALDRDLFTEACARGLRLRQAGVSETPGATDPLRDEVLAALATEPLKTSQVLERLPEDLRPAGDTVAAQAQRLGYLLKKMDGVEPTTVNGHRHYRLTPGTAPSQPRGDDTNPALTGLHGADSSVEGAALAGAGVSP